MRAQTMIGVLLGALATAALAQVATAPVEQKGGNVQVNEAAPASNQVLGNRPTPSSSATPRDEAVPADPPPNSAVPIEPKR